MCFRRLLMAGALALAPACGGGGGGPLALLSIQVLTQPAGPLSPFGTTAGGDEVRLRGVSFPQGATILFGLQAGINVRLVNSGRILVESPPGGKGIVDVTVTDPATNETTVLANGFRYIAPPVAATVLALTGPTAGQASGPIAGGVTVEMTGTNFKIDCTIFVGGVQATVDSVAFTAVRFQLPAAVADATVDVEIRNPEGLASILFGGFFYTQEFSLARAADVIDADAARQLYRRAGFAATEQVIAQAVAQGLKATVTGLLDYSNDTQIEIEALALYGDDPPPSSAFPPRVNQEWWIKLILTNGNPLQERLAYFLHDHFATNQRNFPEDSYWWMHEHIKLFRRFSMSQAEGGLAYDWRRMCVEIAKDRAMLEGLDGLRSTNEAPNENFARELWELFMLGEGVGYTQADIVEASRAFTGMRRLREDGVPYGDVIYNPELHDASDKTVFGVTGRFGYDSISPFHPAGPGVETDARDTDGGIVALTLAQRPVEASTFICRKLAAFFLAEDPDDGLVAELAADLRAADWNMRPVLEKIFCSKAFFSRNVTKGKIRSPVEFVFGFLRASDITLRENLVRVALTRIGQLLLEPPDVNGWPTGAAWMGSQAVLERINFLVLAVSTLNDVPAQIDPLIPPPGNRAPAELVDHISRLLGVDLSTTARDAYIAYVTLQKDEDQIVPFNFDPTNDEHLLMKTRGLVYMIGQYHDGNRQ